MKKISCFVIALAASTLVGVQAQVAGTGANNTTSQGTLPEPTAYSIVANDANSRVWERTVYEQGPNGTVIARKHQFTELTTGLNYQDPQTGQWQPSKEEIDILPNGGAAATQGAHQVYFPGDIAQGVIQLATPDGKQLQSRPVALAYDDGSQTVLFAILTNSIGELVGSNQVIYPDAFEGATASLRYTYTKAGFEQDVIVQGQLPPPSAFDLNGATAKLLVMTEFFDNNNPEETPLPVNPMDGLSDTMLTFGTMKMVGGRAFSIGTSDQSAAPTGETPTYKSWVRLQGRKFLIEEVPYSRVAPQLEQLPITGRVNSGGANRLAANSILNKGSAGSLLPPSRGLKPETGNRKSEMIRQLAGTDWNQTRGLVLDYVTLYSSFANYTFRGDMTYYISGSVILSGTNTFEGGTVIKYINNSSYSIQFQSGSVMKCQGSAYRPIVMTSMNDNSVGETISGSTGNPASSSYDVALLFQYTTSQTLSHIRVAYATAALVFLGAGSAISDAQFVNCGEGLQALNCSLTLENALFSNVGSDLMFACYGSSIQALNVTFDRSSLLCWGLSPGASFMATNCIVANVTTASSGDVGLSGSYNGFYNSPPFGSNPFTNTFNPFQTVGAGNYYLSSGCNFTNKGTANVDPALLADLATKTTYPPIVCSNQTISVQTNFSPQAPRDTNSSPDLGYHYDPLDYITDTLMVTNAPLTVSNGAAIACYNRAGILLQDGSSMVSVGTPVAPNWLVRYQSVQEQPVSPGGTNVSSGQNVSASPCGNVGPNGTFQFTHFATPAAGGWDFYHRGSSVFGNLTLQNNELWGGANDLSGWTNASTVTLNNNLFWRSSLFASNTSSQASLYLTNNLFWGSSLVTLSQPGGGLWAAFNNDFDTCTITNSTLTNGYNAYLNCTNRLYPTSTNDIVSGSSLSYQPSWLGGFYQPPNSPLTNAGNTTADQVGLYHFTTQTNQMKETNSIVDIGYHYVATDTNGIPLDSNGDGIPDYLEDANGNGLVDNGETNWALAILAQPASQTVIQGTNATFGVTAAGVAPLCYQWWFNATNLVAGAANAILTLTNVQTANVGSYNVVVTNNFGSLTSSNASLTVLVPPIITREPTNLMVLAGNSASFSVTATGTAPLNYQWYFNGTNARAGSTNSLLTLTNVQLTNGGGYCVVVTNNYGSATSVVAALVVFTNTVDFDFTNYIFNFVYQGSDGTLTNQYAPGTNNGSFNPLACVVNGTNAFLPSNFGGLSLIATNGVGTNIMEIWPWDANVTFTLMSTQAVGNALQTTWQMGWQTNGANNYLTYSYTFQMTGRKLTIQVTNVIGVSGGIDLDRCEKATNSVIICVPYLTMMNVLYTGGTNGAFCSMYFDWEKTASSTIYPKYGFYSPTNGVISTTSVFYAQQAKYLPRTDGLRTNVNESIYLTVSPSLADVLPSVSNPQSSYKNTVATNLVFDNWEPSDSPTPPVTFSNVNAQLQTLHNAGVSNLWVLLHTWQNRGYDNGYPDVLPAKPDWGGDPGLVNVSQTAANCGYLFGLHENYVDFYTNATSWNAADCALNTNGLLKLAWFNTVSNIQSYEMKPTLASNYASHFAWLIHSNYSTTSAFLDVHSSMNPSDKVDYDVTNASGAGTFLETLSQYRALYGLLRASHNGPVSGEGNNHMLYLGYIDDVEAQINSGSMIPHGTNNPQGWAAVAPQGQWLPLLVDFDLLKLHDKTVVHGVGYLERFYADTNNTGTNYTTYLKADVLEYMATELAYGHGGFIATPGRYNYFDGTNTYNTNAFVEVAQLEQRHVLPVQRLYANATPVSILYHDPVIKDEVSASDYIRRYPTTFAINSFTNSSYMSQVRVTYDNGVVVCINRHLSQQWKNVQLGQPGGWFDYNAVINGTNVQWTGYTNVTSYTLPTTNGWVVYVPAPLLSSP